MRPIRFRTPAVTSVAPTPSTNRPAMDSGVACKVRSRQDSRNHSGYQNHSGAPRPTSTKVSSTASTVQHRVASGN